jgi:hypothetical protein
VLENDPELISSLVEHVQQCLVRIRFCNSTTALQMGSALAAALENAIYHGNFELTGDMTPLDCAAIVRERRDQPPYRDRKIHVRIRFSTDEALFVVRDEGSGFDHAARIGATHVERIGERDRGLTLMHTFMDGVTFNEAGNEVTLVKRRTAKGIVEPAFRRGGGGSSSSAATG